MAKGTTIGSAYVQIIPSAEGIQGKLTSLLNQEASAAGLSAGNLLSGALGKAVAGIGVAGAAKAVWDFGAAAVDAGKQFDSSMSQVAATMGTTTDQIGELRDFAQQMGATTAFSATEAADALNYMALAGYDAETSMEMLPTVLDLAAAGGMDLASASDMITDSQSALGLSLGETSDLVDKMATAASNSNTSVSQLGDAILTIGGTAKNMAGGTDELATTLGLLADNGIKGAEGGTHLRNMILSLTNPTEDAKIALEDLDVKIFDARGNMRSFADIFPELSDAMADLTQEERLSALNTIFNKTDISSVNALLDTTRERWENLGGAISDSAGAAEQMANTQLDNLAGDITLFESALEGAKIALSDEVTPALRDMVQWGTDGMSRITEAIREDGVIGAVSELGEILGEKVGEFFTNLPELAVTAVKTAGETLFAFAEGVSKSVALNYFDETTYAADNLKDAYQGLIDLQNEYNQITGGAYLGSQFMGGGDAIRGYSVAIEEAQANLDKLRGSEEARTAVLSEVASGTMSYKEASDLLGTSINNVAHMLVLQKDNTNDAAEAGDGLAEALEGAIEQTDGLIESNDVLIGIYPAFIQALQDAGGTVEDLTGYLNDNEIKLEDWQKAVDDATDGVINGFQKVDTSLDLTLDQMAENLEFNIRANQEWQENLGILMDAAVESGDAAKIAFVQYMEDMGIGAATQIAAMTADDGAIAEALDRFGPLMEAAAIEGVAGMTAGIDSGSPEVQAAVSRLILEGASAGNAYGSGMSLGELFSQGVAAGLTKMEAIAQVQTSATTVVNTARSTMRNIAQIASPARLFAEDVGEPIADGVAAGITSANSMEAIHLAALEAVTEAKETAEDAAGNIVDLFAILSGATYGETIDYSSLMLQSDNLEDFFRYADLRDQKIEGMGIDLEAEGWRTTAELLTDWMEANGAYVEMDEARTEDLIQTVQESQETTTEAILDRLDRLSEQLADMVDTIASLRVELDSGALVGEMRSEINDALGRMYKNDGRGI